MSALRCVLIFLSLVLLACSKDSDSEEQPIQYTLSTSVTPTGAGTITGLDRFYTLNRLHDAGSVVNLVADPDGYYLFVEWTGSVQSRANPLSFIMDSDKEIICVFELRDSDEDGVTDNLDLCWNTPEVEEVDENGCSDSERDTDRDGIIDISDTCPDTPWGEYVDQNGCSESQKDTDGDGVMDDTDLCPDTPLSQSVGEYGCPTPSPVYLDENGISIKCYEWAQVGNIGVVDGVAYTVVDEALLRQLVASGENVLNVCTTKVTNMKELFQYSPFNQDINSWDVSNVTDMSYMFFGSEFDQPIGDWDVSSVSDMSRMFAGSPFNQPIGNWDVSQVTDMTRMFSNGNEAAYGYRIPFNQDLKSWNVGNVTNMSKMFSGSEFNQDIRAWDVSNVTNMGAMFRNTPFNQDLSSWNVGNVMVCSEFSAYSPQWTLPKPNFVNCDPN